MYEGVGRGKKDFVGIACGWAWPRDRAVCTLLFSVLVSVFAAVVLIPGVAAAELPCANEGLRSAFGEGFLPDCRAYEMVSPPYKEGYPVFVAEHGISGDKAILSSLGTLDTSGDSESPVKGVLYLDMRTVSGWKIVSALNAPSSQFVGEYPVAAEPVSGETLWEQHSPQESITKLGLYARSLSGNPAFRFIGPLNIPFEGEPTEPSSASILILEHLTAPVAATKDYSHVVMEAERYHWPFDATAFDQKSLYEYSGTGNTRPVLVGVKGEEKGSTELIGLCGTTLGGGASGSTYNALSNDGQAVFFTVFSQCGAPKTNEVFARVNGALIDPGPAKTVDVSASECTIGGAECADESGKNFEGASENGQRVFFTSTQKLTNDAVDSTASGEATKGRGCARREECNLYEYRFGLTGGPSPRLVPGALHLVAGGGVAGIAGVAEDGSRVYFVSRNVIASGGTNEFGVAPEAGQPNLYVYDAVTEKATFIATLEAEVDEEDWLRSFFGRTTEVGGAAGQFLLFESVSHLTPDTTGGMRQLFEYDAESGELVRVSKGEDGYNQNGNGVGEGVPLNLMVGAAAQLGAQNDFKSLADRLNVSEDGRTIVFATAGRLSARASSAAALSPEGPCVSLYEFHSDGALASGSVHLVSDGRETQVINGSSCGPTFQAMDASGGDVMFEGSDSLLPGDVDGGQRDIYDARVGGGFAVPTGEEPGCGSGCEGVSSSVPVLGAPASASDSGEAPLSPVTSVGKKAVSVKSRKVKRKGKKHRKKHGARGSSVVFAGRVGR